VGRASVYLGAPFVVEAIDSEPEPDVMVYSNPDPRAYGTSRTKALLAIEVAESSIEYDRGEKSTLYAEAGVPEYWVLNLVDRELEVFRDPVEGIYRRHFRRGERARCAIRLARPRARGLNTLSGRVGRLMRGRGAAEQDVNLYWVETADHDEDWFVVAGSERRAAQFHEKAEGYELGDAFATFVVPVPKHLEAPEGWPSDEILEAVGAQLHRLETPRVVEVEGRRFVEGYLEHEIRERLDDRFEVRGQGRPNQTKRSSVQ
jgi:hypothetical protein